jgi:CheY-like chemotaxis protein
VASAERPARTPERRTGTLSGTATILVVEDERSVRELTARILRSAGYTVILVADGGEALAQCERSGGRVQLVLTDVVMPTMSGRELADRIAEACPEAAVLYMSG